MSINPFSFHSINQNSLSPSLYGNDIYDDLFSEFDLSGDYNLSDERPHERSFETPEINEPHSPGTFTSFAPILGHPPTHSLVTSLDTAPSSHYSSEEGFQQEDEIYFQPEQSENDRLSAEKKRKRKNTQAELQRERRLAVKSKSIAIKNTVETTKKEIIELNGNISYLKKIILFHPNLAFDDRIKEKTHLIWNEAQIKIQEYNKFLDQEVTLPNKVIANPSLSNKEKKNIQVRNSKAKMAAINKHYETKSENILKFKTIFEDFLKRLENINESLNLMIMYNSEGTLNSREFTSEKATQPERTTYSPKKVHKAKKNKSLKRNAEGPIDEDVVRKSLKTSSKEPTIGFNPPEQTTQFTFLDTTNPSFYSSVTSFPVFSPPLGSLPSRNLNDLRVNFSQIEILSTENTGRSKESLPERAVNLTDLKEKERQLLDGIRGLELEAMKWIGSCQAFSQNVRQNSAFKEMLGKVEVIRNKVFTNKFRALDLSEKFPAAGGTLNSLIETRKFNNESSQRIGDWEEKAIELYKAQNSALESAKGPLEMDIVFLKHYFDVLSTAFLKLYRDGSTMSQ